MCLSVDVGMQMQSWLSIFNLSECLSLNLHFSGLLLICKENLTVVASGRGLSRDENNFSEDQRTDYGRKVAILSYIAV